MMDQLEFEEFSEGFAWALRNKPLLEEHEPELLRFIEMVESRIAARLKELRVEAEGKAQPESMILR